MPRTPLARVAAAALLAAAGVLLAPVAPTPAAVAAPCSGAGGVTAVVDFNELGGGVTAGCDADGGGKAAAVVFHDAGYTLESSQQPGMQGFVCKIQGKPADGDCAQNDSFWSLWWSDGTDGEWHFSSQGVNSLDVPDGGYVAFSWHQGGGDAPEPGVTPTTHEEESAGSGGSSGGDGNGGGSGGSEGSGGGSGASSPSSSAPSPSETPSASEQDRERDRRRDRDEDGRSGDRKRDRDASTEQPSEESSEESSTATPGIGEVTQGPEDVEPVSSEAEDGEGLPAWVPVGLIVLALGAAVLVPILRRRPG